MYNGQLKKVQKVAEKLHDDIKYDVENEIQRLRL